MLSKLPARISQNLVKRKGFERVKAYGALWQDNLNNPFYSIVVPIGGLRIKGYLEAVINPLFNLPNIKIIGLNGLDIDWYTIIKRYRF